MPRSVESADVDPLDTPPPVDRGVEALAPVLLDVEPPPIEPDEPVWPVPLESEPLLCVPDEPLEPVPLETEPPPVEPDEPLEPAPLDIEPLPVVPEVLPLVDAPPVTLELVSVDPETPLGFEPRVPVLAPGDAAGFWAASCASRLHASKSACVGAASARPDVLKSVAAATSAHALMLRFMIDLPDGSEVGNVACCQAP